MDLSVAAVPLYFASMGVEHRVLRRRSEQAGVQLVPGEPGSADPAQYVRPDTLSSLGMGVLSLTTPITAALVSAAAPRWSRSARTLKGRSRNPGSPARHSWPGRLGWVAVGTTVAAAAATTIADRRSASADTTTESGRRLRRRARRVAQVGGVVAIATAGIVISATSARLTSSTRMWSKGRHRDLGSGVVAWTVALVGWDLGYYLNHRLMHEVRALWAIHVPHHSSERYNLSTALRQPVASAFGAWVPYGLMARAGIRPKLIETSRALNLIYQFWIHTDTIRTIGPAERVLNTPSHHRVHHGSNGRYLDRNHAGVLIVWDKLFGTFQPELPDEPVVYGLTRNIGSHNLWTVSTHEYRSMFADVARSTTWRDRLGFVLRGPGWATKHRHELDADRVRETDP